MKYATLLTFNRKVCMCFIARKIIKRFKMKRGDLQYETFPRTRICMVGQNNAERSRLEIQDSRKKIYTNDGLHIYEL